MTLQTASQIVLFLGVFLSAIGGFGSYYYGKIEEGESKRESDKVQNELKAQIEKLDANTSQTHDMMRLLFQAQKVKQETWIEVETNDVPPGTTAYLMLLFTSDKGRISGKVRVKGSENESSFSTTANDKVPVAVRNLWLPKEGQYKMPTTIEFTVTEKTEPDASLNIYTQGWIDSGQEPH